MSDQETKRFSGVAGRVLWGTLSLQSLLTGVLLGLTIVVSNWVLTLADAGTFVTPLNHVLFAFVVARFVLNGQFGEWQGSVFSTAGGSSVDVVQVVLRYLALTSLWLLPLIFAGFNPALGPQMMDKRTIVLSLLYLVGSVLTPPLALIASVTAESFADLFSARHWKELFGGRMTDLLSVYATYTGGMAIAALLSTPPILIAFGMHWKLGAFVAGLGLCFLLGMSLDLLGRLCGFFALGDLTTSETAQPAPGLAPADTVPPVAPSVVARPVEVAATTTPAPQATTPRPAAPTPAAVAESPTPAPAAPPTSTPKKPPLLNAKDQVDPILDRFGQDPGGALAALEDLRDSYAVSPQVMAALCICRHRVGEAEEALRLAGEALPLAFERGHSHLAADIFKELRAQAGKLGLSREQVLTIAGAAATKDDLSTAGEAYSMILIKDPGETRAIEGLLQVAERILREKNNPAVAIKVYRFLEQRCAGTPMAQQVSRGIAAAERRLEPSPPIP